MRRLLLSSLAAASFASGPGVAGAEQGWFFESGATGSEAGTFLSWSEYDRFDILRLRAGFRFSDSFSLRAGVSEFVFDPAPGETCANGDFTCLAARERAIDYATGYSVTLAPELALVNDLSLYGHLRIQDWNVAVSSNPSMRKSDMLFGIGVGYDISNPLRLQLEYRSMNLDIKLTSVGFTWRF